MIHECIGCGEEFDAVDSICCPNVNCPMGPSDNPTPTLRDQFAIELAPEVFKILIAAPPQKVGIAQNVGSMTYEIVDALLEARKQ